MVLTYVVLLLLNEIHDIPIQVSRTREVMYANLCRVERKIEDKNILSLWCCLHFKTLPFFQ